MFEVFLRPRRTLVKLISTSISSSTAFPQGEAFRFFFSANGHMILCMTSSRIIVLDVTSDPVVVRHELKTWRRPLSATILDDGSLLAVVSSRHQVNIYSLSNGEAKHIQVLALNDVPRTLALSPTGGVLAIAYNSGIEVYALGEGVLTDERRAVRCAGVDSISFSSDGTMILGSSMDCERNVLVTITVPYSTETDASLPLREVQTRLWTTQILFPDTIQGYSHASLLPLHAEGDGGWFLGHDCHISAFRAARINNPSSGTPYFVNPELADDSREPLPFMAPTADSKGELVALGFQECSVWLYGVPSRLDIAPPFSLALESYVNGTTQSTGSPGSQNSYTRLQERITRPNVLQNGRKVIDMPGINAACWVGQPHPVVGSRLVAVAPGGINLPTIGDEDVPVDSGRVLILDFERAPKDGEISELEIEIGEAAPTLLQEPNSSMDTEVELERRRTRLHRGNAPALRLRTSARASHPPAASRDHKLPSSTSENPVSTEPGNDNETGSTTQFPEIPYDNTQPRSRDTLQRAATAAATTRGRYNPRYSHDPTRVRREQLIPHESDADNWVPPPPPYTREPDAPLPDYLRQTLLPTRAERIGNTQSQMRRALTTRLEGMTQNNPPRSLPTLQRLNTITGPRFAGRIRRTRGDSEAHDIGRQPSILHRRRESSSRRRALFDRQPEPAETQSPQQTHNQTMPEPTVEPTPSGQDTPIAPSPLQTPPQSPSERRPDSDERLANDDEWQESAQIIQSATSGLNFHPFSFSTPELRVPASPVEPGPMPNIPGQRDTEYDAQNQDTLLPTRRRTNLHRRVSTDPTHSQSSMNDDWRRQIEAWNEHTIYERSKRRNRCVVM